MIYISVFQALANYLTMAKLIRSTEVLWSTESSGQLWNTCMWDLYTGSVEQTFKGGISAPNTLCFIKDDYLVSAECGKPLLHHWLISKKDNKQTRIVLPGKAHALAVTKDGYFCVAAIAESVYIWQVNSGRLQSKVTAHYQPVRCLALSVDGSYLLTAGEDAIIHCWSLSSLVDQTGSTVAEPIWSSSNHSLPVTDICVGCVGYRSRAVSLSMDQSCRMYEISSGEQIASFVFDVGLTKVCMSACQSSLYVGTVTGTIHKLSLHAQVSKMDHHVNSQDNNKLSQSFTGHSKEVTCLALSLDGVSLASGSKDMTARLWHTPSGQCVRTLPHKGTITNLLITPYPTHMVMEGYKPSSTFNMLDRHLHNSSDDNEGLMDMFIRPSNHQSQEDDIDFCRTQAAGLFHMSAADREQFLSTGELSEPRSPPDIMEKMRETIDDNKAKLEKAMTCNKGLYEFSVKLLTSSDKKKSDKKPPG